jgi:hypothetical protein
MPIQVYKCEEHGEFNVIQKIEDLVWITKPCPVYVRKKNPSTGGLELVCCDKISRHVIEPLSGVIVKGGTGGGKDMHRKR